jgi:hypothetical protein
MLYQVMGIDISPNREETVIVAFKNNTIGSFAMNKVLTIGNFPMNEVDAGDDQPRHRYDPSKADRDNKFTVEFKWVYQGFHYGAITHMDICA